MAKVTQRTLTMIQKLKARVIKLLEAKTSERIRPITEPLNPGGNELSSNVALSPRAEEETALYRRVLQEAEKDERKVTAILQGADSNRPEAAAQKRPSTKSKGKSYRKSRGKAGKK